LRGVWGFVPNQAAYTMLPLFGRFSQASHDMTDRLVPGAFVRHPALADWGIGQIQSVICQRITVNFENAGKQLINGAAISLVEVDADELKAAAASQDPGRIAPR
jgi:transcription elongation factor GreA-like protein